MSKAELKAPGHLSAAAAAFWDHVVNAYALERHHLQTLEIACGSWDRAESARQTVATDGMALHNRHGELVSHPLIKVEREARAQYMRAIRELGLDLAEAEAPRPPTRSGRGKR